LKGWDSLESDTQFTCFEGVTPTPPVYHPNHKASKGAVGDIFRWAATEMELSEKSIFEHPWVDALHEWGMEDDDDRDSPSNDIGCQSEDSLQRVEDWIMT
jgi:hypothetical protein